MNIQEIFQNQQLYFKTGETLSVQHRRETLKKLKNTIKENEQLLNEAIYKDLRKSAYETYSTEISLIYEEFNLLQKNVKKWSGRKRVPTNLANFPGTSYVQPHPYGVSLILSAWNYPLQLSLLPAIDALAAGNTVILKPSEIAPHTSSVLAKLINHQFPSNIITAIEGGVDVAGQLLDLPFDKIFFTGSQRVGKIVMTAAVKHLTNITLELGGKSPAIVSDSASLDLTAKRIIWGKFTNCGQTCIAPDYLLVHESILDKMLVKLKEQADSMYHNSHNAKEYGRIINENHFDRLISYLDQGKIYTGGQYDRDDLWIAPTILTKMDETDPVMTDEIFGPILPVIPFSTWEEAIRKIKNLPHPLAVYVFSNRQFEKKMATDQLQFGGMTINDTLQHIANPNLPFGGVGSSGMGSYHGKWGFDAFSHYKSIQKRVTWIDLPFKYPPFTEWKEKILRTLIG